MRIFRIIFGHTLVISFLFVLGCGGPENSRPNSGSVPVITSRVVKQDLEREITATGTVEPLETVAVVARVAGTVDVIHFRDGSDVKKGQLLFTLDARPFQARLAEAEAQLLEARAQARNAAERVERYKGLVAKEFISKEEFREAQAGAAALAATVQARQAAVEQARLELSFSTITSPIDGRAGEVAVKPGNLITAQDTNRPLVTIHALDPIQVAFTVPEDQFMAVRAAAQAVELPVRAAVGTKNVEGVLSFIDNQVNRASGTVLLKATFPNSDRLLWPGLFVNTSLVVEILEQAPTIPTRAIQQGQQGAYVYRVQAEDLLELVQVKVGYSNGEISQILEGLSAGDEVVTDGQLRVAPGTKIERSPEQAMVSSNRKDSL